VDLGTPLPTIARREALDSASIASPDQVAWEGQYTLAALHLAGQPFYDKGAVPEPGHRQASSSSPLRAGGGYAFELTVTNDPSSRVGEIIQGWRRRPGSMSHPPDGVARC